MDDIDRHIVQVLQADATLSVREIADVVGLTPTPCWRRLQNLEADNVIKARVALINPEAINLKLTAIVAIKTNEHNAEWTTKFHNTIGHYDHQAGEVQRYSCGQAMVSEALFVPRSEAAPEGDGFLLTVATDFETRNSSLLIFEALHVAQGPVAKVHLSHRVPPGFHGFWRQNS